MSEPTSPEDAGAGSFELELTPAELKLTYTAVKSMLNDFGHDEREIHDVLHRILAKLPDEATIRAIEL